MVRFPKEASKGSMKRTMAQDFFLSVTSMGKVLAITISLFFEGLA